jgi:hypothetical protein
MTERSALSSPAPDFLDRVLSRSVRLVLIVLCALVPTVYVIRQYQHRPDLTQMILFGGDKMPRALPEIRQLNPEVDSPDGYDGQFYAQIALDPTLRRPEFGLLLDDPMERGQRIVLPALAYVFGFGRPQVILFVYALLNLVFWYGLLVALLRWTHARTVRDFLVLYAILLTTGALISIERSLTDLPAVTFGFLALGLADAPAVPLLALAILTKPTSTLFLTRYLLPLPTTLGAGLKRIGWGVLALVPTVLWIAYLVHTLHEPMNDGGNLAPPFIYGWQKLQAAVAMLAATRFEMHWEDITPWEWNLGEVLTLLCLAVQALFLFLQPRPRDPVWIMGLAFASLFLCLSHNVYAEQIASSRTVLPLTIAFNLLLRHEPRPAIFWAWFIPGNLGLFVIAHQMIAYPWWP